MPRRDPSLRHCSRRLPLGARSAQRRRRSEYDRQRGLRRHRRSLRLGQLGRSQCVCVCAYSALDAIELSGRPSQRALQEVMGLRMATPCARKTRKRTQPDTIGVRHTSSRLYMSSFGYRRHAGQSHLYALVARDVGKHRQSAASEHRCVSVGRPWKVIRLRLRSSVIFRVAPGHCELGCMLNLGRRLEGDAHGH